MRSKSQTCCVAVHHPLFGLFFTEISESSWTWLISYIHFHLAFPNVNSIFLCKWYSKTTFAGDPVFKLENTSWYTDEYVLLYWIVSHWFSWNAAVGFGTALSYCRWSLMTVSSLTSLKHSSPYLLEWNRMETNSKEPDTLHSQPSMKSSTPYTAQTFRDLRPQNIWSSQSSEPSSRNPTWFMCIRDYWERMWDIWWTIHLKIHWGNRRLCMALWILALIRSIHRRSEVSGIINMPIHRIVSCFDGSLHGIIINAILYVCAQTLTSNGTCLLPLIGVWESFMQFYTCAPKHLPRIEYVSSLWWQSGIIATCARRRVLVYNVTDDTCLE